MSRNEEDISASRRVIIKSVVSAFLVKLFFFT